MELSVVYRKTALSTIIAAIIIVAATVFYYSYVNPTQVLNSVAELEEGAIAVKPEVVESEDSLKFVESSEPTEYIWIPMPEGVSASDVAIENHYMDGQLWIAISSDDVDFYKDASISGNIEYIEGGQANLVEEQIILKINMAHVYEYNTIFEDGVLYIEKVAPSMLYDQIVMIDPAGQVAEELINIASLSSASDSLSPVRICTDIASKLKSQLETDGVRVYVTSLDEREIPDESRLNLLNEIRPDMYIRIETSADEDSKVYGTETVYNGTYFIPGFGSVELADLLESNVTTSIGGRAAGLIEAGEDDMIIRNATVPAATVKVGYYTNTQENILLNRDDYRTKIAQGIRNAVLEAFSR